MRTLHFFNCDKGEESMSNDQSTTLVIGGEEVRFKNSTTDFNQYINEQMPTNKVAPAFNFLMRIVVDADKEKFKKLVMKDNLPNGAIVMQLAGHLAEAHGAGIEITIKKSDSSQTPSSKTDTAS
jgi:hypothetical protein